MKRIYVFLIGFIGAFLLLESGLRLGSFAYLRIRKVPGQSFATIISKPYVILCLGNSYTFGFGASFLMSYPAQLQRMFNEKIKGQDVRVINKGAGLQNTAELLRDLKFNIDKYSPDLILIQTGQPNFWNHRGISDYLKRQMAKGTFWKQAKYFFDNLFFECRVYRLAVFANEYHKNMRPAVVESPAGDVEYKEIEQVLRDDRVRLFLGKSTGLDSRQYMKARNKFLGAIRRFPHYPMNYVYMGVLDWGQNNFMGALQWYIRAIRVDPGFRNNGYSNEGYRSIQLLRFVNKKAYESRVNRKIDSFIENFSKSNKNDSDNFVYLNKDQVIDWIKSDIREINRIAVARKIRVILQNYPKWFPENLVLLEIGNELKLPFMDHYSVFQEKIGHGIAEQDLFTPDGHCNARGYGVMAENIFNKIVAEGFLRIN